MSKTSVQCRKKGTTTYKEQSEEFLALPEFDELQIKCMEAAGIEVEVVDEGFLSSLKKPETPEQKKERQIKKKEKLLKTYTRLKKHADDPRSDLANRKKVASEEVTGGILVQDLEDYEPLEIETVDIVKPEPLKVVEEGTRINQYGNCYCVGFTWRGKYMIMKIFFPEVKKPNRKEVEETLCKIYPGCKVHRFDAAPYNPNEPMIHSGMKETAA